MAGFSVSARVYLFFGHCHKTLWHEDADTFHMWVSQGAEKAVWKQGLTS